MVVVDFCSRRLNAEIMNTRSCTETKQGRTTMATPLEQTAQQHIRGSTPTSEHPRSGPAARQHKRGRTLGEISASELAAAQYREAAHRNLNARALEQHHTALRGARHKRRLPASHRQAAYVLRVEAIHIFRNVNRIQHHLQTRMVAALWATAAPVSWGSPSMADAARTAAANCNRCLVTHLPAV